MTFSTQSRRRPDQKPYEPVWGIHPHPLPGECLSSWILRLAAKRGKIPYQIIQELYPDLQVWNRDVDLLAPAVLRGALVTATGVPGSVIDQLCLSSLEGAIDEIIDGKNQSQQIRPLGTYHRTRRAFGQQFCPECLAEDQPFFRLSWRLTLFPVCTRHGSILRDACHRCDAPIVPHQGNMFECHICGASHGDAERQQASSQVIQQQVMFEHILEGGWIQNPFLRHLHPLAFFALVHRVLATLIKSGRGGELRRVLPKHVAPGEPDFHGRRTEARYLRPRSAHNQMHAVSYLLHGWPFMLVSACQDAGVHKSWLLSDVRYRTDPFELKSTADSYLSPGSANNRSR